MARIGMQTLIDTVRGYANAAPDEWTISTDTSLIEYWSDEEIQRVLDRHKREYIHGEWYQNYGCYYYAESNRWWEVELVERRDAGANWAYVLRKVND